MYYVKVSCEPTRLKISKPGVDVQFEDKIGLTVSADDEQVVLSRDGAEVLREYFYNFLEPRYNVDIHSVRELVCWIQDCVDDVPSSTGEFDFSGARNKKVSNSFLKTDGLYSNVTPIVMPSEGFLHSISASTSRDETWNAEVFINGVLFYSMLVDNKSKEVESDIDLPINLKDEISLYCNGVSIKKPRIIIKIRK